MRLGSKALWVAGCLSLAMTAFSADAPVPVGHWKLDGDAQDGAAPAHAGKIEGRIEFEASPVGGGEKTSAAWLNGVDAFVTVENAPELNFGTGDFSVSAWILPLEMRRAGVATKDAKTGWALSVLQDGSVHFEAGAEGAREKLATPAGAVALGQWYHLVASIARGGEAKLFVNGEALASGKIGAGNLDNAAPLLLGNLPGEAPPDLIKKKGLPNAFCGMLDDVRLYKGALSSDDVAKLTDAGIITARRRPQTKTPFAGKFSLEPNEVVVFVGEENLASEPQTAYLETLLLTGLRSPSTKFRNMAWEGDTVYEQWRILNFGSWRRQMDRVNASIVIAQYGQMEALQGKAALDKFIAAYEKLFDEFGQGTQRIVLVSPMPFEKNAPPMPDQSTHNADVKLYADAIGQLAKKHGYLFVDLFSALEKTADPAKRLTSNGVQLTPDGQWAAALAIAQALGAETKLTRDPSSGAVSAEPLRAAILAKNKLWFNYWRPGNWAFLAGDRTEQPSSRDHRDARIRWFPAELQEYQALIQRAEVKIEELARDGK